MHPFKTFSILGLSPVIQSSACRLAPLVSFQQCLAPWTDLRLHSRLQINPQSSRSSSNFPTPTPSFAYRISSAFSAKKRPFERRNDFRGFEQENQPSEKRSATGRPASGQDAYFVSKIGNSNNVAFGVADGVGGWADSGIDSAHFSHALCENLIDSARANEVAEGERLGARELLTQGYAGVVADESISGGGSTACVAVAEENGHVEVAKYEETRTLYNGISDSLHSLGDSGFVQLRLMAVHHYSNPQTHAFNTPYQLSIIPPKVLARSKVFGGMPLRDFPRDASVTSHQVRHGDVLVFATDGVWDNISPSELLRLVNRTMTDLGAWVAGKEGMRVGRRLEHLTSPLGISKRADNKMQETKGVLRKYQESSLQTLLAIVITAEAKAASQNTFRDGPFAKEVQKFYPSEDYHGGKVDDICVVVAIALEQKFETKSVSKDQP